MASHLSGGRVNLAILRESYRRELLECLDRCAGTKVSCVFINGTMPNAIYQSDQELKHKQQLSLAETESVRALAQWLSLCEWQ